MHGAWCDENNFYVSVLVMGYWGTFACVGHSVSFFFFFLGQLLSDAMLTWFVFVMIEWKL